MCWLDHRSVSSRHRRRDLQPRFLLPACELWVLHCQERAEKEFGIVFLFNIVAQKTERNERNEVCENTNWLQLMEILPCSLSSKEVHCRSLSISFRYSSLTHRGHCNKLYTEEPCAVLVALSKAYCQLIFLDSLTACYHCTWWFYSVSLYDALSWERYPPFTVPPCFETTLVLLLVTALPMLLQHRP